METPEVVVKQEQKRYCVLETQVQWLREELIKCTSETADMGTTVDKVKEEVKLQNDNIVETTELMTILQTVMVKHNYIVENLKDKYKKKVKKLRSDLDEEKRKRVDIEENVQKIYKYLESLEKQISSFSQSQTTKCPEYFDIKNYPLANNLPDGIQGRIETDEVKNQLPPALKVIQVANTWLNHQENQRELHENNSEKESGLVTSTAASNSSESVTTTTEESRKVVQVTKKRKAKPTIPIPTTSSASENPTADVANSNDKSEVENTTENPTNEGNSSPGITRHGRDVRKRSEGTFCQCGLQFSDRKELDQHLKLFSSIYANFVVKEGTKDGDKNDKGKYSETRTPSTDTLVSSDRMVCTCGGDGTSSSGKTAAAKSKRQKMDGDLCRNCLQKGADTIQ